MWTWVIITQTFKDQAIFLYFLAHEIEYKFFYAYDPYHHLPIGKQQTEEKSVMLSKSMKAYRGFMRILFLACVHHSKQNKT